MRQIKRARAAEEKGELLSGANCEPPRRTELVQATRNPTSGGKPLALRVN